MSTVAPIAGKGRRISAVLAWCLYDFGNSAFPTVIVTFVFAAYFTTAVAPTPEEGTALWGNAMAVAGLTMALFSPVFGSIADQGGRRKPWLGTFTFLAIVTTAALWFVEPDPSFIWLALVLLVIATFTQETASVFYNAMLGDLAHKDWYGRISGWGWGLGYFGGLSCLVVALFVLIEAETPPFGLDPDSAEPVRAGALLVALWFAVFCIPLFFLTPDRPSTGIGPVTAVRQGLRQLYTTIRNARSEKQLLRFLIAHALYTDGLNTLFAFGGIYAAGTFGMSVSEIIIFGIAINVTAGLGAGLFAFMDDKVGSKPTILVSLAGLSLLGGGLLFVESHFWFWVLALPLGLFVGPTQAASRSLMSHLTPDHLRAQMFGIYALSGKITSFIAPALLAWTTAYFASQRAGMATILIFLIGGALILWPLRPVKK
ncbi:MFS transporter [Telmatospirillum sp. J64-1]|uniref:MFS transporter n=1 Tax=Telmatospirillum sp. J64-1 TaxID=2502183 RepID=UPI00115CE70A|nr:MFS transporter [Telmatospirillum sp. J64-1]